MIGLVRGINFSNKGAEAMGLVIAHFLVQECHFSKIIFNCDPPNSYNNKDSSINFYNFKKSDLRSFSNILYIIANCFKYLKYFKTDIRASLELILLVKKYGKISGCFDASGFTYSDQCAWGESFSYSSLIWTKYCNTNKIPSIFLPQAWGPFKKNIIIKRNTKEILQNASLIFYRDSISQKHLRNISHDKNFYYSHDIVNLFNNYFPITKKKAAQVSNIKLRLGISPNARVSELCSNQNYEKTLISIVERLSKNFNITLFANEIDDIKVLNEIQKLSPDISCEIIKEHFNAVEIRELITSCDILISSRFHSLVFALSNNVPAISIGWSYKYDELFNLYNLSKFNFGLNDFNEKNITEQVKILTNNLKDTSRLICAKNEQIRIELLETKNLIKELFNEENIKNYR